MTRSGRYYLPPSHAINPVPLGPAMEKLKVSDEPNEDAVLKQLKKTQAKHYYESSP